MCTKSQKILNNQLEYFDSSFTQECVTTLLPLLWSHNKADITQLNYNQSGGAVFKLKVHVRIADFTPSLDTSQPLRAD